MARNKTREWAIFFLKVAIIVAVVAIFFVFEFVLGISYLFCVVVIVAIAFILANRFVKMRAKKPSKKLER